MSDPVGDLVTSIQGLSDSFLELLLQSEDSNKGSATFAACSIRSSNQAQSSDSSRSQQSTRDSVTTLQDSIPPDQATHTIENKLSYINLKREEFEKKFVPAWRRENMKHRNNLRKKLQGRSHIENVYSLCVLPSMKLLELIEFYSFLKACNVMQLDH